TSGNPLRTSRCRSKSAPLVSAKGHPSRARYAASTESSPTATFSKRARRSLGRIGCLQLLHRRLLRFGHHPLERDARGPGGFKAVFVFGSDVPNFAGGPPNFDADRAGRSLDVDPRAVEHQPAVNLVPQAKRRALLKKPPGDLPIGVRRREDV